MTITEICKSEKEQQLSMRSKAENNQEKVQTDTKI